MWVYEKATGKMVNRSITFTPGFIHIFNEVLCNAADNKAFGTDAIQIIFDKQKKQISVRNNGMGIPIHWMKDEEMWVPTLIFGVWCTSSQYDVKNKVTAGKNGLGSKCANVFSNSFTVETANKDFDEKFHKCPQIFKQEWTGNMAQAGVPDIQDFDDDEFTKVS